MEISKILSGLQSKAQNTWQIRQTQNTENIDQNIFNNTSSNTENSQDAQDHINQGILNAMDTAKKYGNNEDYEGFDPGKYVDSNAVLKELEKERIIEYGKTVDDFIEDEPEFEEMLIKLEADNTEIPYENFPGGIVKYDLGEYTVTSIKTYNGRMYKELSEQDRLVVDEYESKKVTAEAYGKTFSEEPPFEIDYEERVKRTPKIDSVEMQNVNQN